MGFDCISFPAESRYQTKVVAAGERSTVFDMTVDGGYAAFIDKVANAWFTNTHYLWYIDGALVEKVQREIAPINEPVELKPPFIARKSIIWVAVNGDTSDHAFEVVMDGMLCRRKP